MGSVNLPRKRPIDPQPARVTGLRPSIPSPWPAPSDEAASGRVRFPAALARFGTPAAIEVLLPRDAAAPSPVLLVGGLFNSSIASPEPLTWMLALLSAAALSALALSMQSKLSPAGVSR